MPRLIDLVGQRFGRLVVEARAEGTPTRWLCRCDCGAQTTVLTMSLRTAPRPTRSCGCLKRETDEQFAARQRSHGRSGSPEHDAWHSMIQRCTNSHNPRYSDYGGRGITVCERWREAFENFLADMGERPTSDHSIDRKDNERGYEPGNCRWATRAEQNANKRPRRHRSVT